MSQEDRRDVKRQRVDSLGEYHVRGALVPTPEEAAAASREQVTRDSWTTSVGLMQAAKAVFRA
jgi:hypothetical protein